MNLKTAPAADIAAYIEELKTKLTDTAHYCAASGRITYALQGVERINAERALGEARFVYLPIAQAREVQA